MILLGAAMQTSLYQMGHDRRVVEGGLTVVQHTKKNHEILVTETIWIFKLDLR